MNKLKFRSIGLLRYEAEEENSIITGDGHMVVIAADEVGVAHAEEVLVQDCAVIFAYLRCTLDVYVTDVARACLLVEEENIDVLAIIYG